MKKTITFSISTGYVGSKKEDTFTLEDLGIDENLNNEELEKEIDERFQEWVWDNIDASWSIDD